MGKRRAIRSNCDTDMYDKMSRYYGPRAWHRKGRQARVIAEIQCKKNTVENY